MLPQIPAQAFMKAMKAFDVVEGKRKFSLRSCRNGRSMATRPAMNGVTGMFFEPFTGRDRPGALNDADSFGHSTQHCARAPRALLSVSLVPS